MTLTSQENIGPPVLAIMEDETKVKCNKQSLADFSTFAT
jgi:hypothetical protein